MDKKNKHTDLSEIGEFGLIKRLTEHITYINSSSVTGIGDDGAIVKYKNEMVITTDILLEGIHFNLIYTPLKHLGYKATIVNLSDIYAMNAVPRQILVAIGVSGKFSIEHIEELYQGINLACKIYNIDMIGGDTSSSLTGLTICITAIGESKKNNITLRNTAKVNDLICVSGDLGGAYMGLQLLEREKTVMAQNPEVQPELVGYEYILERQLKPEARKDIIELLHDLNIKPNSMIDISDGLSSDILHICEDSGVGCKIFEEKIPIHRETIKMANEFQINPIVCALMGGEDYELLFTLPLSKYDIIKNRKEISIIGHITNKQEGTNMVMRTGEIIPLKSEGWNTFRKENKQ